MSGRGIESMLTKVFHNMFSTYVYNKVLLLVFVCNVTNNFLNTIHVCNRCQNAEPQETKTKDAVYTKHDSKVTTQGHGLGSKPFRSTCSKYVRYMIAECTHDRCVYVI